MEANGRLDNEVLNLQLTAIDKEVKERQHKIVDENPHSVLAMLIRANFENPIPEFKGTEEEVQLKRYLYYKEHYFDHIDFKNQALIRTPFINDRIQYYLDKLTVQIADSLIISIDTIMNRLEPNPEAYRFYLSEIFNKYIKLKHVGMDAIYVYMVDHYYAQGKAPWVDEVNLNKMKTNANNFRDILIGKTMPNFTTFDEKGDSVTLNKINTDYTILLFWSPTCPHCKKSMPDVIKFYEDFKAKTDLTLMSICTPNGDKEKECWEFIKEKGMENFLNTSDPYQRYRRKIYIPSTPKIFILDKDKKILIKDIPAEELERIMDEIIKAKDEEMKLEKG